MSLQKLCYLVNEKNKLALKRRSTRHKLYRLKQIARARKGTMPKWSDFKLPMKWSVMLERDFRVVYMEAELAFKTVNLDIARHTQEYASETRHLSKELGTQIGYGNDNIIDRIYIRGTEDDGSSRRLEQNQIEGYAAKHEFELVFLQSM